MSTDQTTGVLLSLGTAALWGISPIFMASAARRIGSRNVNLLRLALASIALLLLLAIYRVFKPDLPWPSLRQVELLSLSGVVGLSIGDAFYYEALVLLGPRRACQINTAAPVVAFLIAWATIGERITLLGILGVAMVLGGVSYASIAEADTQTSEPGQYSRRGLLLAILSAVCIGIGAVLGRVAYAPTTGSPLDPFVATVVRVGSSAVVLWTCAAARGRLGGILTHLSDPQLRRRLFAGTATGPVLGMICYVSALKFAPAGLVSTITATSPLFLMPIVARHYRARIPTSVVLAMCVAIAGVALIFVHK